MFPILENVCFCERFFVHHTDEAFFSTSVITVPHILDDFLYFSLINLWVLLYNPASRNSTVPKRLNAVTTWFKLCHLKLRIQDGWYGSKSIFALFLNRLHCCCRYKILFSVYLHWSFCLLTVLMRSTYRFKKSVTGAFFELPQHTSTIFLNKGNTRLMI